MKLKDGSVIAVLLIAVSLVAACVPTSAPIPPTATPNPPTATPMSLPTLPPTEAEDAEAATKDVVWAIEVTFDGNECIVSGPAELSTGKHPIALKDLSGQHQTLWVIGLVDGKTYQDLLDLQSEPGEVFDTPDWTVWRQHIGFETTADGAAVYNYVLNEAGEHAITIGTTTPDSLWLCAPLKVVEAPSQ